jgi:hypothetical protein
MIKFTAKQLKQLEKADEAKRKEFAAALVDNYSASALAYTIIELLLAKPQQFDKIRITEEQFKAMFKLVGIADATTGEAERRGRPSKKIKNA